MLITLKADIIAPTAPTIIASAVSTSSLSIALAVASSDVGGLSEYVLERSTTVSGTYSEIARGLSIFPYADSGLSSATAYFYRAKAIDNSLNEGNYSSIASATTDSTAPVTGTIRTGFGHYKWIDTGSGGGGQTGELAQIAALAGKAYMAGVKWSFDWDDVETARGVYSFTKTDAYVAQAAAVGKKIMLDVKFEYFGGSPPLSPSGRFPAYLATEGTGGTPGYTIHPGPPTPPTAGNLNMIANLWDPPIMARFNALWSALASRYKDNATVVMGTFGETSVGSLPGSTYSLSTWITAINSWITTQRAAWPNTELRVMTNYLAGDNANKDAMKALMAFMDANQIAGGGPDNYSRAYDSNPVYNGFNGGIDYRNRFSWVSESQYPASSSGGPSATSSQIYNHNETGALVDGGSCKPHYYVWFNNTFTNSGQYHTYPAETEPFIASINGASNTYDSYAQRFFKFISPTGSDAAAGDYFTPWAITSLASKSQVAGKRIGLLNGTYNLSAMTPLSGGDDNLINVQVTSTADTTVAAVNPRLAIIDGHSGSSYPHINSGLIGTTSNTGRLIFDGLKITGFGSSGMVLGNSANQGSATTFTPSITVRNCEFTGGDIRGTVAGGNHAAMKCYQLQNCLFENNWCHDNIARNGAGSTDHFSDIIFFHQKDCIIRRNSFERSGGVFGKWSRSVNITVDGNYFDFSGYNSESRLIFDFNTAEEGANGFIRIRNNVIIGPQCCDMRPTSSQLTGGTSNLEIVNNTIVHTAHGLIGTVPAGTANIYNNIFSSTASGDQSFITINPQADGLMDRNCFYNPTDPKWGTYAGNSQSGGRTTYGTIALYRSAMGVSPVTGQSVDANSITTNPLYTSTGVKAERYKLQGSSPCLTLGRSNGLSAGSVCAAGAWGGATPPTQIGCDF